jgi:hypothetical protein
LCKLNRIAGNEQANYSTLRVMHLIHPEIVSLNYERVLRITFKRDSTICERDVANMRPLCSNA